LTSAAPEEIVPGHISDAVAIKVYQLPTAGSAKIMFKNFICDGATNEFNMGQIPGNLASIFVKVDSNILRQGIDYTVNWQDSTVTLLTAPPPADKEILSVITFSVASESLLDSDYFISDGATLEYVTNAPWIEGIGSVVLVDGLAVDYELFQTTDAYASLDKVGIRFAAARPVNELITYMITADENQTASIIKIETLPTDGVLDTFTLANPVNGAQLTYGSGYVIDYSGVTINLRAEAYVEGATLTVAKLAYENYTINGNQINFTTPPTGTVEVISFYNHSVEAIQREIEYTSLSGSLVSGTYDYFRAKHLVGGKFKLSRSVVTDDYVWVIKNGKILTHSVDYYLDADHVTVKLAAPMETTDYLDIVCFSDQHIKSSYGYMQFKDILNRTHYKRISKAKSTRLARDLLQKDAEILLVDGSKLSSRLYVI